MSRLACLQGQAQGLEGRCAFAGGVTGLRSRQAQDEGAPPGGVGSRRIVFLGFLRGQKPGWAEVGTRPGAAVERRRDGRGEHG